MPTTFWARGDNNTANNPALNPTVDPAIQISFVPSGTSGDILLEYNMGNTDPDTMVEIGGIEYAFSFQLTADLPTLNNDGAQQVPDQFEGSQVFLVEVQDYPNTGDITRLFFLPDDDATQAEMDAFGNGAIDLQNINSTNTGIICYAAGTMILTPSGEKPVEDLKSGDEILTADGDPKHIKWVSSSSLRWPGSPRCELPIEIRAGSLGMDCPNQNLCVSPQHRILVHDPKHLEEVFVPAKGLTDLSGVRVMRGKRSVEYYHILLDKHETIVANGTRSESFFPGPQALRMLSLVQRKELADLLKRRDYGPLAKRCLTVRQTKDLVKAMSGTGASLLKQQSTNLAA